MRDLVYSILVVATFFAGYFFPRKHYTFDPKTYTLCAVQWNGDSGCAELHFVEWQWIPILD